MYIRMFSVFLLAGTLGLYSQEYVQQSITGAIPAYLTACLKAVNDPEYFQVFRSQPEYAPILECGFGGESAKYILTKGSPQILGKLEEFRKLDRVGGPFTHDIAGVGRFSGTTLRYIVIADQLQKFFKLPKQPTIVEVGAGFGGQCYILSKHLSFSRYFIYDLPEVEQLINQVVKVLEVKGVNLLSSYEDLPIKKIDLFVSNYAFSECDRRTQLDYFERVIKHADRGYVIFNQLHYYDSLSVAEFIGLLNHERMNPEIHEEPIFTYEGNVLIMWDRGKRPISKVINNN